MHGDVWFAIKSLQWCIPKILKSSSINTTVYSVINLTIQTITCKKKYPKYHRLLVALVMNGGRVVSSWPEAANQLKAHGPHPHSVLDMPLSIGPDNVTPMYHHITTSPHYVAKCIPVS